MSPCDLPPLPSLDECVAIALQFAPKRVTAVKPCKTPGCLTPLNHYTGTGLCGACTRKLSRWVIPNELAAAPDPLHVELCARPGCGNEVYGRPGKKFCSYVCQRAHNENLREQRSEVLATPKAAKRSDCVDCHEVLTGRRYYRCFDCQRIHGNQISSAKYHRKQLALGKIATYRPHRDVAESLDDGILRLGPTESRSTGMCTQGAQL